MTVLTLPARPGDRLRPLPWRRMLWVTWRQHRATFISVSAVLGAVAVFLLIAGQKIHHDYAVLTACHPLASNACQTLNSSFNNTDWTIGNTVLILMQLAPVLIGAFAGAPMLARELETGTFRYAWTQGFGRERWTAAKLTLLGVFVAVVAGAFSQLFAWFFQPFLPQEDMNVLNATVFDTRGISFAAWTLAAFMIGAFGGMLIRRIVPAMAVTLGVYLGLAILTWTFLRAHYPLALVTSNPDITSGLITPSSPWVLGTWYTGPGGKPVSQAMVNQVLGQSRNASLKGPAAQAFAQHGFTQWWRYIPVSRFWPMQFVEGGWLLALSILLAAATVWLVRRRAA